MINLLPNDVKQGFLYARRNTNLLHWVAAGMMAIAGLVILVFAGQWYISRSIEAQSNQVAKSKEILKLQNLEENQKRLEDISNNIKLVVQVLSKEVLFSKLIKQLGSVIPQNTTLEQLQIDKVQGALTINANAVDIQSATQLQLNLQDPANKIFASADIESINCNAPDPKVKYPCSVQIKALFSKDNPFLLINNKTTAKP